MISHTVLPLYGRKYEEVPVTSSLKKKKHSFLNCNHFRINSADTNTTAEHVIYIQNTGGNYVLKNRNPQTFQLNVPWIGINFVHICLSCQKYSVFWQQPGETNHRPRRYSTKAILPCKALRSVLNKVAFAHERYAGKWGFRGEYCRW